MKKILIIMFLCLSLIGATGCGCGRLKNRTSPFYKKELSFDFDSMGLTSYDIKKAIEMGIKDAEPIQMVNGHFRIERNNYSYNYEEGTTKVIINFYNFEIDARADEKIAKVFFKGLITTDFENQVKGETYTIDSKGHKEMEFEIDSPGNCIYDEKTGNFTIIIPEYKETGTITQTNTKTTNTKSGYIEKGSPVTNTWDIDETYDNVSIKFVSHTQSK